MDTGKWGGVIPLWYFLPIIRVETAVNGSASIAAKAEEVERGFYGENEENEQTGRMLYRSIVVG